jgi:hypothetical protein
MNSQNNRALTHQAKRIAVAMILTSAAGLAAVPAPAHATTAAVAVSTGVSAAAGDFGYFTGNGVRIWSRPGTGTIRGLGYRNEGFCVDSRSGNYYHGRNTATGVTGWAHIAYVHVALALEC